MGQLSILSLEYTLDRRGRRYIIYHFNQEIYRKGISVADALFLCIALGGDHNKHPSCVGSRSSLLLFFPEIIVQISRIQMLVCCRTHKFFDLKNEDIECCDQ